MKDDADGAGGFDSLGCLRYHENPHSIVALSLSTKYPTNSFSRLPAPDIIPVNAPLDLDNTVGYISGYCLLAVHNTAEAREIILRFEQLYFRWKVVGIF
jgi:hypothetical protein